MATRISRQSRLLISWPRSKICVRHNHYAETTSGVLPARASRSQGWQANLRGQASKHHAPRKLAITLCSEDFTSIHKHVIQCMTGDLSPYHRHPATRAFPPSS